MQILDTKLKNTPENDNQGLNLAEIRSLITSFSGSDSESISFDYENMTGLKAWANSRFPKLKPLSHPRLCIFAAHHGAASKQECLSAQKQFQDILENKTPLADLVAEINADLKLYELDFKTPTSPTPPAMTEGEAVRATAYGMMAIEQGADIVALLGIGSGSNTASENLLKALESTFDPLEALLQCGGFEHAALLGAMLATKLANVPVTLEGKAAQAAFTILHKLNPHTVSHMLISKNENVLGAGLIVTTSLLKLASRYS